MYLNKVKSHYNYIPLSSKKGITFVFIKTPELWPDVLQCLNIGMQLGAVTHLSVQWCTGGVQYWCTVVYWWCTTPHPSSISSLQDTISSHAWCSTAPHPEVA